MSSTDMSVNITNSDANILLNAKDGDDSDSCSSFHDSDCDSDYPITSLSDSDVVSHVFGDFFRMRTKKLTDDWMNRIRPHLWKCRWLELQIKKCHLQALKYDQELAAYNVTKHVHSGACTDDGFCSKLLEFSTNLPRDKIMRRSKRIKIENRVDMAPYVSNLMLRKDGRPNRGRMEMDLHSQEEALRRYFNDGDFDDEDDDDDESLFLSDANDSLEAVFRKIEVLKSRIIRMRHRVNKVEEEEKAYNFLVKKEINDIGEDSQCIENPTEDETIDVIDKLEQPNNNEATLKVRSLAQIIAPKRSERIENRRASSNFLERLTG